MRALCLIRETCGRDVFLAGLEASGYRCVQEIRDPVPGDVLLIWNRFGAGADQARLFDDAGATVLVAENGWLGKNWRGKRWYSICRDHHAGAGKWTVGPTERWDGWGVELKPWRMTGERVILGQRGLGERGIASPDGWAERIREKLGGRIRKHPGTATDDLESDLAKAGEVVTWNSGAAIKALLWGIPVRCDFPQWIGMEAASSLDGPLNRSDEARLRMFRRLAWSMWTEHEVADGIRHVLS